jgi:hypothetical protein
MKYLPFNELASALIALFSCSLHCFAVEYVQAFQNLDQLFRVRATRLPLQAQVSMVEHVDGMEDRSRKVEEIAHELLPIDGETATEGKCPIPL